MKTTKFNLPLAIALAAALSASPALAQGKGNGNGNRERDRVEERDRRDRDDDRWDDRRDDRRDQPRFERRSDRRVPPGWCQGRGNPHNTAANCRWNNNRSVWERYDSRDRRWEDRTTYERGSNDRYDSRNGGSYEQAHRDFHYTHDRQCRERAAQRPTDLRWQVQVRQECRAIHEDFHRRWGTSH
jgi:Ni/Co efflux regulator RcnB